MTFISVSSNSMSIDLSILHVRLFYNIYKCVINVHSWIIHEHIIFGRI